MWLGPNAVLAFAREGYSYSDISLKDMWDYASFPGLWKMAFKYAAYGMQQYYRSIVLSAQVKELQKYIPELKTSDATVRVKAGSGLCSCYDRILMLVAGIRAQAIDVEGNLVDDFIFDSGEGSSNGRLLHVRNAPSPAATSSLAIAQMIADRATADFKLTSNVKQN
jgi:2-hydroxyglutarate dehydrogenase